MASAAREYILSPVSEQQSRVLEAQSRHKAIGDIEPATGLGERWSGEPAAPVAGESEELAPSISNLISILNANSIWISISDSISDSISNSISISNANSIWISLSTWYSYSYSIS